MPLTITRDVRDVLHSETRRALDAPDVVGLHQPDLTTTSGAELARTQARRLHRTIAMLEILGWAEEDDRIAYELPIDETVVEWMKTTKEEIYGHVLELDEEYQGQQSGDDAYFHDGCSREESLAATRAAISQEEALFDLLERLVQGMFDPSAALVA